MGSFLLLPAFAMIICRMQGFVKSVVTLCSMALLWVFMGLPFILGSASGYFQRLNIFSTHETLFFFNWDNRNWGMFNGQFGYPELYRFIKIMKFLHIFLIFYFFAFKFVKTQIVFNYYRINPYNLTSEIRVVN